jgi:GNAT superfamily N-acetyltransferase
LDRVPPWSDARIWDALAAHRWYPPSARRATTEHYELAVTPGSPGLTWIYGFRARDLPEAGGLLDEARRQIETLGGTGTRIWVTPRTRPEGLGAVLGTRGFATMGSVEVLAWDLRDDSGTVRLPSFRPATEVAVREVTTVDEYVSFQEISATIFGEHAETPEAKASFLEAFKRTVRETGHSDFFTAYEGTRAIGCGGLGLTLPVAFLWGAGVLPEHRGRGAYAALVEARCRSAVGRGSEVALVTARTETSGPILKRHGFRTVGPLESFEARWSGERSTTE